MFTPQLLNHLSLEPRGLSWVLLGLLLVECNAAQQSSPTSDPPILFVKDISFSKLPVKDSGTAFLEKVAAASWKTFSMAW